MASVNRDEEQRWVPTHVQVLVIRARGLRAKGKHGTSDAYTVMQLGKEKYSTRLMEKTTEPEWGEECSFELQPGVLDDTGRDGHPAGTCDLTLTVMHRALIGLDVFLGQTVISLDQAFRERVCIRNEWYKLHSKTGKKEKERGELQLTVQFTRHNLTASMYDLSMKDKPRSAFIRLRERMRARKRGVEEESSSAVVPGGYGASSRPRGRLPSDGGGEEDYEDDEGGELRRSKMRSYFLHGRLRKSSDTRSSTSLGSESSESSSRGGSLSPTAGISVVVSDLSNSPSNSSNLTADNSPDHTVSPSPLVSPVRQMFDEVSDHSIPVPHSLYTDSDAPILLPSVCVNGNPVETSPLTHHPPSLVLQQTGPQIEFQQDSTKTSHASPPEKGKPTQAQTTQPSKIKPQPSPELQPKQPEVESKSKPDPQFYAVGLLQKSSALSLSLQNLSRPKEEPQGGGPVEGRRWSFDKPGEEEKAAISAALEHAGLIADEAVVETDVSVSKLEVEGKKKRGLFSHSRAEKEETGQAQSATEGRHRGWFSSKEPYNKPRGDCVPSIHNQLVVPQTDSSSSTTPSPLPLSPTELSDGVIYQRTNPFISASFISPTNPFFSLLLQNPFFHELHTITPVTTTLPFFCSPAIDQPEVPASRPRNPMLPMHVAEPGNAKGNLVDGSLQNITNSFSRTDASDDSDTYTLWHNFIGDGVKLNSMMGPQNMTIPTYSYLAEPTKQNPTCCKGDLNRSKAQENLCNLIVDSLPHFKAEANFMHCSTHKNGLNNFVPVDTLEYSEFDYSLLHKSNINFSELNTVACPYPTCLNKDKVSIVSVCKTNVIPGAIFGSSGSPDPLAINSESLDSLDQCGNSEPKTSICISSKRQTDDRAKGSVEIQTLSLPYCNSGILGASSIETSKSRSMSCNVLESKSILKDWRNFKSDDCFGVGDVELQGSAIHERTHLNVHPETYPLESSIPFGPGDSALQGKLKMEKDATSNQDCGASFVGTRFDLKNFKDITDSIDLCKVSFTKQKVTDSLPCTSKESFRIGCITETVSGLCEVDPPNGRRPTLSLAVSQQHAVSHSLYESVDSEQYLTCMSQNISTLPNSDSPQEGFPINDQSPKSPSVLQDPADIFQDAWRKTGAISQDALPNPPVSLSFLPKVVCSQNTLEKCDLTKEVIKDTNTNESQQNDDLPKDTPMNLMFEMITRRAAEERLKVEPHTFNSNDLCSTELPQSHPVQNDAPPPPKDLEMITGFCQSTENTRISDFVLEPTTCITQDLVTTDLLLENVFVAQRAVTHSVCTSPVTHPVPGESCAKMELCPESIKELQVSKNKRMPTTVASVPQGEHLEGSSHLNNKQIPLSEPSTMDHLNSGHLFLNPASPFLDLLPLASSTPHIAVGINTMPQFPFPMPSASAKTLLHTTLATAALSPVFTPSNNHFPQEEHQVACHLSSPHPVKPLTPPDEKRSEGRSVLDKIKSTINPGRGHQGDLEYEKKLLVEGGGSYYHLNHSELVSLLLQREAELQQERKEYEHRGLLLQKREVEIKKMKFLIRDLEDYIDTLLVRIMEQTPALLQVRSKMK